MKIFPPIISVCIATYNRSKLLSRALRGVFKQTYQNIEIVIVDDCSSDDTKQVIADLNDKRIRYFRNSKNSKWGITINRAVQEARADLIAILGDDDEWFKPQKLEQQYEILKNDTDSNIACVFTGYQYMNEGKVFRVVKPKKISSENTFKRACLSGNPEMSSTTVLLRKHVWNELGGVDTNIQKGVDSEFFRRIVLRTHYTIEFISGVMVNVYCDSPNRMTPEDNINGLQRFIQSVEYQLEKYAAEFAKYPAARAKRYIDLAVGYRKLYNIVNDRQLKNKSWNYMRKSVLTKPSGLKIFRFIKAWFFSNSEEIIQRHV